MKNNLPELIKGDSWFMSNIKMIQNFIESTSGLYCDDCLSGVLNIKPRQQVNPICNKLKTQGFLKREVKQCCYCSKDKLVNFGN